MRRKQPYPYAVQLTESPSALVVRLMEPLDPEAAPRLAETLRILIATQTRLVLDMSHCDYLCSTGVSTLYYYWSEAQKLGGNLVVAACPPFVTNVLTNIIGTDLIAMHPAVEDALAALDGGPA